jgi:hypothetical protein
MREGGEGERERERERERENLEQMTTMYSASKPNFFTFSPLIKKIHR